MARSINLREIVCDYLSNPNNQRFQWGRKDCALFVNDYLVEVFGMEDVGEKFRGQYKDRFGAFKTIKKLGYDNVEDIPDTHLDVVTYAELGDIALKDGALGVVTGVYAYFLTEDKGLAKIPVSNCTKFWRYECRK